MKKCKTYFLREKLALLQYTCTTFKARINYFLFLAYNFFQHYLGTYLGSKKLNSALGLFSLFSRPTLLHEYCTPTGIGGLTCAQVFLVRNGAKIVLCLFTVFICSFYNDLQEYFCIF